MANIELLAIENGMDKPSRRSMDLGPMDRRVEGVFEKVVRSHACLEKPAMGIYEEKERGTLEKDVGMASRSPLVRDCTSSAKERR